MSIENNKVAEATSLSFTDLNLAEPILKAVLEEGYSRPTPIQAQAIPLVLQGGDLLASAQTGTGKTAGFTLPILQRLIANPDHHQRAGRPRCLILTPTRELASQVEESVKTYGKYASIKSMVMFGGVGINPQIQALKRRIDIVVATPGRLLDHAGQRTIDLSGIEILVLDEADRMLDMGFIHDIRKVLALLPAKRQNLLFSATFSDEVKALADRLLDKPGYVEVARRNTASQQVSQTVHLVPQSQKRDALVHLIKTHRWSQVLVFTRTKHGANRLAESLEKNGIAAAAIHGNKSQSARTQALSKFKDGSLPVLVATDIAARGLDIDQLPQVVNFELPNVAEDYVHRIGRTGRAGATGAALSLVDAEEVKLLVGIEKLIKRSIERLPIEGFVPPAKPSQDSRAPSTDRASANRSTAGSAGRNGGNRDRQGGARAGSEQKRSERTQNDARKPGTGRRPSLHTEIELRGSATASDSAKQAARREQQGKTRTQPAAPRRDARPQNTDTARPSSDRRSVQSSSERNAFPDYAIEPIGAEHKKREVSALFRPKTAG